ncbi:MAG: zinc metallopeptidase [Anaerolineae bacterium]|nr:zinc metallopeptidase [Anaerolineae bacterium]
MLFGGNYLLYLCFTIPALLLGLYAQFKVQSTFNRYSRVGLRNGASGSQVARQMLDQNQLFNVDIELIPGRLNDHYDPTKKVLRLSQETYHGRSIAAAGIAAHEAGHAIQHAHGYAPLHIRTMIIPTVRLGSWLGPIMFFAGLMLEYWMANSDFGFQLAIIGLVLFAATAIFSIITLPIEINASKRAKQWLASGQGFSDAEVRAVDQMLDAAALTYVAAAVQAVMTILYYATLLFRRRR